MHVYLKKMFFLPQYHGEVEGVDRTESPDLYEGHAEDDVGKLLYAQSPHELGEIMRVEDHIHPGEPEERHHRVSDRSDSASPDGCWAEERCQILLANLVWIFLSFAQVVDTSW